MKVCKDCNKNKPLDSFNLTKGRNGKYVYRSYCKPCQNERHKEYKKNNLEKVRASSRKASLNSYYTKYQDGHYSVYLLPEYLYVGITKQVTQRMWGHKSSNNRNTNNYQILHTYNTEQEALAKEAEYHAMGYDG